MRNMLWIMQGKQIKNTSPLKPNKCTVSTWNVNIAWKEEGV